jgi:transcriptional regulator with XRE-family HTH domain
MQIKETMQRYGYTPTTLAKKMGVFDSTVSRLVTGNPTVQKLQELAEQIGCQRWEFFLDEMKSDPKWVERFMDELKAAGFEVVKKGADPAPSPAPTGVGSLGAEEQPSAGGQQASDGERPDLITIDPVTGESRKYKLIG